ncbi:CynX/NimT family MFS transporter [Thalassococcus sp. BH17M4-6]|uniref:MFS transporter n=1 Tax=Thalassococcus sp. BH17M4-6 TaxID=3413148 RepID=UPI003BECE166
MAGTTPNRWFVLAVLFTARVTMAFQFQAVAALSPVYMQVFGVGLSDIGFLIGLYLAPGLIIALPGGAIGQRFGDRRVIAFGMGLMLAGALVMLLLDSWGGQIAGRLLAGTGGVLLNVLMSKVVTDYFAGREIATAMGIFVNSWPVGIAAALLVLPLVATGGGLALALGAVLASTAAGLAVFLWGTAPTAAGSAGAAPKERLRGAPLAAVLCAGAIWGLYNGALGMVFGFGPAMLVGKGWSLAAASATTSVTLWLVAVSVPLGGYLADRTGQRDAVMVAGFAAFAALLILAPSSGNNALLVFALLGLSAGLSAGPIMSLPAQVLGAGTRAVGMGIFFTLFYVGVVFAPVVAGIAAQRTGLAGVAFYQGAVMLAACGLALWAFRGLARGRAG